MNHSSKGLQSLQFVYKMKKSKSHWGGCFSNFRYTCFILFLIVMVSCFSLIWISLHININYKENSTTKNEIEQVLQPNMNNELTMKIILTDDIKENNQIHYPKYIPGDIHFIHIPKCGGTTMTALLRELQCHLDPIKNADCCLNPGFCDWHAHRRCSTIKGCINHFPNRPFIFKSLPSVAVFREPISRLLSAWFYRGHSPNLDFFQVRPEFKEIKDGKRPKVTFAEYLEMHEYQNIQTRMLGADSFPYRNITITDEIFFKAVEALQHLFYIGLQEEFEISSLGLLREVNVTLIPALKKERDQSNSGISKQKSILKNDINLMKRANEVNSYDIKLYQTAVERFCLTIKKYPDLFNKVLQNKKVYCDL